MPKYNQNKIRKTVSSNKTGDSFGITIPRAIAMQHSGTYFSAETVDGGLLLKSGPAPYDRRKMKYDAKYKPESKKQFWWAI